MAVASRTTTIVETYAGMRPKSRDLYKEAQKTFTGGVNADRRAVDPFPTYAARGQGSHKWDVDGNEYIDYNMGNGATFLGHANPEIAAAIVEHAGKASHFGTGHDLEVEWGRRIQELVPSCERLRFVVSGTEATMLAMRIARAYTGRPKLLRFEGHYHGWHDQVMIGMAAPYDAPATGGVPEGVIDNTIVIPANDLALLERTLTQHRQEIAAVIVEPSGASWNTVPLMPGFLTQLRALTERLGVVLIFDEVITGFRWSPGGAQGVHGISPDLTTMAKIMAGGMPGAAVGGRAEILDKIMMRTGGASREMRGRVFHAGTFAAHALTAAAGIAALKLLAGGEYQSTANRLAARLREGMAQSILERKVKAACYGEASTFHVYFGDAVDYSSGTPTIATYDAATLKGMPDQITVRFQQALQNRGVDLLSYSGGMVSGVHTDEDIERTTVAFDGAMDDLLREDLVARR